MEHQAGTELIPGMEPTIKPLCLCSTHVRADVKSAPHAVRADGKSAVLLSQTTSKAGSWGGAPPRKHGSLCAHAGGGESRIGDAFLPDKMIKC